MKGKTSFVVYLRDCQVKTIFLNPSNYKFPNLKISVVVEMLKKIIWLCDFKILKESIDLVNTYG